jgi:alanyl-tRNA synthetase
MVKLEEECVYFEYSPEPILSGVFTYCLFETYGFPLEFVIDEMARRGIPVDENGYHVLEELARERNRNTFKRDNAFG